MRTPLTNHQKRTLALIVSQQAGSQTDFAKFCDYILLLFEDIPGFKNVVPERKTLREIWDIYREASHAVSADVKIIHSAK
ncbi:hypothetical protein [Paraburkholderia sp. RL18-085-BIA-A]|uniref:hypothetical protein n=1 Tax=Paraburkholderia sp. RL18-085-BIA-A TaxID=3031633 RepID=UPI0038B8A2D0